MTKVEVTCRGISPLLMDQMSEETKEALRTGVRPQIARDRDAKEVAEEKIYRDEKKKIGLPALMLFSALTGAGRMVPYKGKKMISTQDSSLLPALLVIEEEFFPFTNINGKGEEAYWEVDKRIGRLDNGTAVCVVRPKFKKWLFTVVFSYDEKQVDETTVKKLFENAGSFQGLGAFRPNCRGPFGRFEIEKWTKIK